MYLFLITGFVLLWAGYKFYRMLEKDQQSNKPMYYIQSFLTLTCFVLGCLAIFLFTKRLNMKVDFTRYLLINLPYLLIGLFIYILLSIFKIHILWYIQGRLFDPRYEKNLLRNYFSNFFSVVFSNKKLFIPALQYLFQRKKYIKCKPDEYDKYKDEKFVLFDQLENKPVELRLNILDKMTDFLKPYLLFAFLWIVLKYLVQVRLFYEPTKITLGAIQLMGSFLKRFRIFDFLKDYKYSIIFAFGVICCFIIPLVTHLFTVNKKLLPTPKNVSEGFNKRFNFLLAFSSMLLSVSFFGADIGKTTAEKGQNLRELSIVVDSIHNKIFTEVASAVIKNDFRDYLKAANDMYNSEIKRYDSLISKVHINIKAPEVKTAMEVQLAEHSRKLKETYSVTQSYKLDQAINEVHSKPNAASDFFASYFRNTKSTSNFSSYGDYLRNKNKWNIETGEKLLSFIEKNVSKSSVAAPAGVSKLEFVLDLAVKYVFDNSISLLFGNEKVDLSQHETLKKLMSVLSSEIYKKKLVDRCLKFFNSLKDLNHKIKGIYSSKSKDIKLPSSQDIESVAKANNNFINEQKELASKEDERITDEFERAKKAQLDFEREQASAYENLEKISNNSEWEELRQDLYKNIDFIECPDIQKKITEFKNALRRWNSYLYKNKMVIFNTTDLEDQFWSFAKVDNDLLEAFARGIMWYKSEEFKSTNHTVSDALRFYKRSNPRVSHYDIDNFIKSIETPHACPGRF